MDTVKYPQCEKFQKSQFRKGGGVTFEKKVQFSMKSSIFGVVGMGTVGDQI